MPGSGVIPQFLLAGRGKGVAMEGNDSKHNSVPLFVSPGKRRGS